MAGKQITGVPLRFDPLDGNCAKSTVDPDIFFPEGKRDEVASKTARAKALCSACPVAEACLMSALDGKEWGIWGGATESERQTMKRNRKQIPIHLQLLKEGKYRVSGKDENSIPFN